MCRKAQNIGVTVKPCLAPFRLTYAMLKYKSLHTALVSSVLLAGASSLFHVNAAEPPKALAPLPSPAQLAWQEDELTLFTHFGMNTYTGRGTGLGTEDPKIFNPTNLDCSQWVRV